MFLSIIVALFFPLFAGGVNSPNQNQFQTAAEDPYWLNLMHYKPDGTESRYTSQLDGASFFFAKDGKFQPLSEIQASFNAMTKPITVGKLKQHPQCAFPERKIYFERKFGHSFPKVSCPQLDEFLNKYDAAGIRLVFSSAYPNNPGSMFGHTFFRVVSEKSKNAEKSELLDYGLSFAAYVPKDDGGLIFAIRGFFGGYFGRFSMDPYYKKVGEYSNWNSRDLWEYELNLTAEQTKTLLRHSWEIETNSHFDYYFFSENCAYHLLSLLEMVEPSWKLTDYFIFISPADSIKKVMRVPGAVRSVHYRPSIRRRLMHRYNHLNSPQRDSLLKIIEKDVDLDSISDPRILDTANLYLTYAKNQEEGVQSDSDRKFSHQINLRQAQVPAPTWPKLETPKLTNRPDLGHDSLRFGIGGGGSGPNQEALSEFGQLSFKFAYHDLLNNDQGYEPFSNLTFPNGSIRWQNNEVILDRLELVSVTSLFPVSFLEKRFSWKFLFDYYKPRDFSTEGHSLRLVTGSGGTLASADTHYMTYLLGMLHIEAFNELEKGYRIGPNFEWGFIARPAPKWKTHFYASKFIDFEPNQIHGDFTIFGWRNSLSLKQNLEIRLEYEATHPALSTNSSYQQVLLNLHTYFSI